MSRFQPGNDYGKAYRWRPGQSGNTAGRPRGASSREGFPVHRSPATEWPKGTSGNPKGRKPGTGRRQTDVRILEAFRDGQDVDGSELTDAMLRLVGLKDDGRRTRKR